MSAMHTPAPTGRVHHPAYADPLHSGAICDSLCGTLSQTLRVAGRAEESVVDGPGLRYALFMQGCPHHCPGCHNPATHASTGGTAVPLADILVDICKNPMLRGVTFSGGEPFCQSEALACLSLTLKEHGYHLTAYTGYTLEALLREPAHLPLLEQLDMLVDGPFVLQEQTLTLPFRGSRNQRIIDVPASLRLGHAVLHPLHG